MYEKGPTFERKKRTLPGTQQGRTQHLGHSFFQERPRSNSEMAMSGTTDLTDPLNPLFYEFGHFFRNKKPRILEFIKMPLIFLTFPCEGNRGGPPKGLPCRTDSAAQRRLQ